MIDFYLNLLMNLKKETNHTYNQDLQSQLDYLEKILKQNKIISEILKRTPNLQMPNWYLGAVCLSQTVWNWQHNFELTHGIKDNDLPC